MRIIYGALSLLLIATLAACGATPGPEPAHGQPSPSPALTELPAVNWAQEPVGIVTTTLPLVAQALNGPLIYDCAGQLADEAWLLGYFGAVSWTQIPTATARLADLRACCGDCPSAIVVHVASVEGETPEGVAVVLHWPDAPMLPLELRGCGLDRGVYGPTNANGDVGFGLGRGSKYFPPAGGPHTIWIGGMTSDCAAGLGWLAGTNHEHPDLGFYLPERWVTSAPDVGLAPGTVTYPTQWHGETLWIIALP